MTETQTAPTVNKHGVKPGDIFYTSWGYDQTNVDYYLVVRVTKAKAEVLPIGAHVVDSAHSQEQVVPNPDHVREWDVLIGVDRDDVVKSKLCTTKPGYRDVAATIVLQSGRYWAWPWKGEPQSQTDPYSGH